MVKRCVRIYIEGGSTGKTADNDFRRGWKKFLMELHDLARNHGFNSLEVVRGKGRSETFKRFSNYQTQYPNDLCVLLVDSEGPVQLNQSVWDVVATRVGDQWVKPDWAQEHHLYLMVQFVETWLLTDPDALQLFFKRGFSIDSLPNTNLEARSKSEIEQALNRATRNCSKGLYEHGHAHEIMEFVRPERVKSLRHGKRLFDDFAALIQQTVATS